MKPIPSPPPHAGGGAARGREGVNRVTRNWSSRIGSQQMFVISAPLEHGIIWVATHMCLCILEYDDVSKKYML